MKRNFYKNIRLFLFPLIILSTLYTFTFADLGNFNSYGSSGGWSSGGSSSSGGGNSWGSSGSSWGGRSSHSGSSDADILVAMIFLAIFGLVALYKFVLDKAEDHVFGTGEPPRPYGYERRSAFISDNTQDIIKAVREVDPAFSADKFSAWAKEVFITLQMAWSERAWEKVRSFEKEELYRQHELQIKEYIDKGRINIIERININNAYLFKYKRDMEHESLSIYMNVRMVDYIIDEKTKAVLKGSPDIDCFLSYILTFMRKKGIKTNIDTGNSVVSCPKCGAPTRITSAGQCEYCGFIVTTGKHDWVLADIEGVKPTADYGPGGVFINDKREE